MRILFILKLKKKFQILKTETFKVSVTNTMFYLSVTIHKMLFFKV